MIQKYVEVVCDGCEIKFVIPKELYDAAMIDETTSFYCPYGHRLCFDEEARQRELEDKFEEPKKQPYLKLVVNNETE